MTPKQSWTKVLLTLAIATIFLGITLATSAQVKTETNTSSGTPTVETSVEQGEVVYVQGNEIVVKMQDGTLRDFRNIPDSARATVDGREIGIRDVKVGMKLQKTVTTTTTPQTITTVQTVSGKVWHVNPPKSVILTLEDGTNQQFTIPDGQKFNVNGQMTDAWGLKKGMKVNATKVVEQPATSVDVRKQLSGSMPPPPPPPADQPILVASAAPAPAPVPSPAAPTATELPKTGSMLPLIGLLGLTSFVASFALRIVRSH
jgi:hypothetical protein